MALALSLKRSTVGVDIGTDTVKAVELRHGRSGWSLLAASEMPIARGDSASENGPEPVAVADAVRRTFERLGRKNARVAAALSGHAVIVKRLTLPTMSEGELAEAIPWEAEQYIPFDLADVQLDYQVLSDGAASRNSLDVLLVAAKKDRIDERASVITQAGHEAAILDVEAFALANAYQMNYPERSDALAAIIHVGRSATIVCLLEHGQLVFTRDIAMGGRLHSEALMRELGVDEMTAGEIQLGHPPREVSRDQAATVLRDVSSQLVHEIRKSVDFYRATAPVDKLSRLVLSGGACQAEGLGDLLSAEFGAPVDTFDPFRRVIRPKKVNGSAPAGPAYSVAVGLAMRREGDR
jgi:type IV pilus assembly protein PilM